MHRNCVIPSLAPFSKSPTTLLLYIFIFFFFLFIFILSQIKKYQMSFDLAIIKTIIPSPFFSFTIPNPSPSQQLHTDRLGIAICYSQSRSQSNNAAAAMIVPRGLETDWLFSTEQGHSQILLRLQQFSRLIIIGNNPNSTIPTNYNLLPVSSEQMNTLETYLNPVVIALCPNSISAIGWPHVPFLPFNNDNVIRRSILEIRTGTLVGDMLIENVEVRNSKNPQDFRRRLRFLRTPDLTQTQLPIINTTPINARESLSSIPLEEMDFVIDKGVLVYPYLNAMVRGLIVMAPYLDRLSNTGFYPKALCVGVGGGTLLTFLKSKLCFDVVGVEADETVLRVAKQHFGLEVGEGDRLIVGNGIRLIEKLARQGSEPGSEVFDDYKEMKGQKLINVENLDAIFEVIMVDLDSSDAYTACTVPPLDFVNNSVFQSAKSILCKIGTLVINVKKRDMALYDTLVQELRKVFSKLYGIRAGEENLVLIAAESELRTSNATLPFSKNLKSITSFDRCKYIRKL